MFRVNSAEYSKMIDAYKDLETVLEEERENLQMVVESSRQTMSGEAVCTWQIGYQQTLDTGAYDEVIKQVQGLCTSMEDMKPLLNRMMEEGELLGEQLESDTLLYPSGNRTYMGQDDILLLKETYAYQIHAECEDIQDTGESMRQTMEEVFGLCKDIVNLSYEKGQLDTACKRLKRIDNLQTAFSRYVRGVCDLDESLACLFKIYVDADAAYIGSRIEGELIEAANSPEINKLGAIFQKSPLDWTEEDCALVAENWEKAVEKGDIAAMEELLGACVDEGNGRFDYEVLGEMARDCKGEVAAGILTRLLENKLPEWKYADCMVEICEEDGVLTVYVMQDVLLEDDNTVTVTAELNSGKVEGKKDIISCHRTYPEEYYEIAAGLLEKDAEGNYKFEELLRKEAGDVGETDKTVMALLYEDKCRVIETAPDRIVREKQFDVTERFMESLFRYEQYVSGRYATDNVYVDEEWTATLMEYSTGESLYANLMLVKLGDYKRMEGEGWNTFKKPCVDITITPQMVGLTAEVDFHRTYLGNKPEGGILYAASEKRAIKHVESLNESVLEHMEYLGYTKQQIINMYLLSENVSDEGFIDHLVKNEYKEAFQTDPDELGEAAKYFLPAYAVNLYQFKDEDGQYTELKNFINGMLYQDERVEQGLWNVRYYLELMSEQSNRFRTDSILRMYAKNIDYEEANRIQMMDILWQALYREYFQQKTGWSEDYTEEPRYSLGECMLQIADLCDIECMVEYDGGDKSSVMQTKVVLVLCNQAYENRNQPDFKYYNDNVLVICPVKDVRESDQAKNREEIRKLKIKRETMWMEPTYEAALSVLKTKYPFFVLGLDTTVSVLKKDLTGTLKNISNTESVKGNTSANDFFKALTGFSGYLDKVDKLESEIRKENKNGMIPWFYTVDKYYINDETVYLSDGINEPSVIQGIIEWDEEGCCSFVKNVQSQEGKSVNTVVYEGLEEYLKKRNSNIMADNECSLTEEQWEALKCMIYGTSGKEVEVKYESILDIDEELFLDCVQWLDEAVWKGTGQDKGVRTLWQNQLETRRMEGSEY